VDPSDVLTRPAALPDAVVRYADHSDGLVDLHLPPGGSPGGTGAAPLAVLLHGGFWRTTYDRRHTRPMAEALAAAGFVVATPEYRRVSPSAPGGIAPAASPGGQPVDATGRWPAGGEDVHRAVAALPGLLAGLGVGHTTTTVVGHSAGGHLALWLGTTGLPLDRVVALAPVADLVTAARDGLGSGAVAALLGGEPEQAADRYADADPMTRLATRPPFPVTVVHGALDEEVPVAISRGLVARHRWVRLAVLDDAEHYGLIDPQAPAWPTVLAAIRGTALPVEPDPRHHRTDAAGR
jgi:acetyl esterase/lipase